MSQNQKWNALKKIIHRLPAQSVYYGSALGAIVLAGGGQIPPGLEFVAGGVGANVLSNLIEEIARGEDVLDDDIRKRTEDAIQRSDIANLLTKQDFLQGYARLIQRLDAQKEISEEILTELRSGFDKVATAEQVDELKALILDLMKNTSQQSVQKSRIFISYARADDEPFVEKLYNDLKDEFDVWWDRVSMPNRGLTFLQEIREGIDNADRLLLVAGPRAFTSDYVRDEWLYAYETYKGINIALRLGDYPDLPEQLGGFDAPDFRSDDNYNERLMTLKRQLAEPVAPIGQFHNVPALPPHFLSRPEALDTLRDLVIADVDKPTLISAEKRTTAVEGMGGIGKSVIATAFAHDRKVRFAFPDGIVWLTAGHKPSMYELYRAVGVALGDELSNYPDETTARQNAQKALADKKCLLILDDVWELPVGRAFRDLISGTSVRLLITTRNLQINDVLNANEYRLKLIDESQAADYLRSWVGDDPDLETIAEKLGYLFLALKLAGARMKKDGISGGEYLRTFDRVSRMKINRQASDREDSLEASITLSVDAAFANVEDEKLLYHTFGIFPEDTPVPQHTIRQVWKHLCPDVDEFDLLETLNALVDLALVERNASDQTITLHDLLHSYSREKLGDRYVQTHKDFLDSYGVEEWHQLSRLETYMWQYLAHHLVESNQLPVLISLLTDSHAWVSNKFNHFQDYSEIIKDIDKALNSIKEPNESSNLVNVAKLCMVRAVIHKQINVYDDNMLRTLSILGKADLALNYANMRTLPEQKWLGYLAILEIDQESIDISDLWNTAESVGYELKVINLLINRNQIEEALENIYKLSDPDKRRKGLMTLAISVSYSDENLFNTLLTSLIKLVNDLSSTEDYDSACVEVAIALSEANKFDLALDLISSISNPKHKIKGLMTLAISVSYSDENLFNTLLTSLIKLVNDLSSTEDYDLACVEVAIALSEANKFDLALDLISSISNPKHKISVMMRIALALNTIDHKRSNSLLDDIFVQLDSSEKNTIGHKLLNDFISTLSEANKFDLALDLISSISNPRHKISALIIVIRRLIVIDQDRANQLIDEVIKLNNENTSEWSRQEDIRLLLKGIIETKEFIRVDELLTLITTPTEKSIILSNYGYHLYSAGDADKAEKIFLEAKTLAHTRKSKTSFDYYDLNQEAKALSKLISIRIQLEQYEEARGIIEAIPGKFRQDPSRLKLSKALAENGRPSLALEVAKTVSDNSAKKSLLSELSYILASQGNSLAAFALEDAISVALSDESNEKNIQELLQQVCLGLIHSDVSFASDFAISIIDNFTIGHETCTDMATIFTFNGYVDKALLITNMLQDNLIVKARSKCLFAIIDCLCSLSEFSQTDKLIEMIGDELLLYKSLVRIGEAYLKNGNEDAALITFQKILNRAELPANVETIRILSELSYTVCRVDRSIAEHAVTEATMLLEEINENASRAVSMSMLAVAVSRFNSEQSRKWLSAAHNLALSLPDGSHRDNLMCTITSNEVKAGQLGTLDKMLSYHHSGSTPLIDLALEMVAPIAENLDQKAVSRLVQSFNNVANKSVFLSRIARAFAEQNSSQAYGYLKDAQSLATEITSIHEYTIAFTEIEITIANWSESTQISARHQFIVDYSKSFDHASALIKSATEVQRYILQLTNLCKTLPHLYPEQNRLWYTMFCESINILVKHRQEYQNIKDVFC